MFHSRKEEYFYHLHCWSCCYMVIWKADWFFSGFISNFKFSINNAFFIACIWSKPFPSAHASLATVDIFILFIALTKLSRLLKEGSKWKWILTLFLCSTISTDYLSIWKSSWLRIIFRDYTLSPLNIFVKLLCLLHLKHCEEIWLYPCIQLAFSFYLKNYILELEIQLFSQNMSHSWLFYVSFFS